MLKYNFFNAFKRFIYRLISFKFSKKSAVISPQALATAVRKLNPEHIREAGDLISISLAHEWDGVRRLAFHRLFYASCSLSVAWASICDGAFRGKSLSDMSYRWIPFLVSEKELLTWINKINDPRLVVNWLSQIRQPVWRKSLREWLANKARALDPEDRSDVYWVREAARYERQQALGILRQARATIFNEPFENHVNIPSLRAVLKTQTSRWSAADELAPATSDECMQFDAYQYDLKETIQALMRLRALEKKWLQLMQHFNSTTIQPTSSDLKQLIDDLCWPAFLPSPRLVDHILLVIEYLASTTWEQVIQNNILHSKQFSLQQPSHFVNQATIKNTHSECA
ncbi:MAG: hypothetical protein V4629_10065 [Pseudomonadota bacterium]